MIRMMNFRLSDEISCVQDSENFCSRRAANQTINNKGRVERQESKYKVGLLETRWRLDP